jgi:hypothetical protein
MNTNSVTAEAYYGTLQNSSSLSAVAGAKLAAASAPYLGRGDKCSGNDDTCGANRMRGQELCVGHMKGVKSKKVEV